MSQWQGHLFSEFLYALMFPFSTGTEQEVFFKHASVWLACSTSEAKVLGQEVHWNCIMYVVDQCGGEERITNWTHLFIYIFIVCHYLLYMVCAFYVQFIKYEYIIIWNFILIYKFYETLVWMSLILGQCVLFCEPKYQWCHQSQVKIILNSNGAPSMTGWNIGAIEHKYQWHH